MNISSVDKNLLLDTIVNAIDGTFNSESSRDEFAVRAMFGLEGTSNTPEPETRRRMMETIVYAAIIFFRKEPIDIEQTAQEFLQRKLMELYNGDDKNNRCSVKLSVRNDGYGDVIYTTWASIGFDTAIPSPHLDTAISEARRRKGYDEANKPMVLIEPPKKEPEVEQIAGDGTVITDGDTKADMGDSDIPV